MLSQSFSVPDISMLFLALQRIECIAHPNSRSSSAVLQLRTRTSLYALSSQTNPFAIDRTTSILCLKVIKPSTAISVIWSATWQFPRCGDLSKCCQSVSRNAPQMHEISSRQCRPLESWQHVAALGGERHKTDGLPQHGSRKTLRLRNRRSGCCPRDFSLCLRRLSRLQVAVSREEIGRRVVLRRKTIGDMMCLKCKKEVLARERREITYFDVSILRKIHRTIMALSHTHKLVRSFETRRRTTRLIDFPLKREEFAKVKNGYGASLIKRAKANSDVNTLP